MTLAWTANSETDLATYRVLRDGVEIAAVTGTAFLDPALTNDTTYSYTLVAVDTHGNRSPASSAVPGTPTDMTAPAVPTGLAVTRVNGKSVLSWAANTEPDLASYRVLRDGVEIATVTATTFTDNGANGAPRSYSLVAVDTHGNRSAATAPRSSQSDVTPPAAPTGLAAVRGDSQVSLSWAANAEPDLASYRVLRDGVEIATVTGRSFVDTGLPNDVTYTYTLAALDVSDNRSAASAPVSATPTDLTPPAVPGRPVSVAGEGQVSLSWTANAEPDLATYRVLRDGVEIATVTAATFVDTGLANDTTYSYTLVAVDTHGNRSAASPAASATPKDLAPAPPTGVTATPGDRRAEIGWTAPADADVVGYRVLAEDGITLLATVTAPTTQVAVGGLTNGTAYRFAVVAVDAGGHVSVPSPLSVAVTPVSPTVPTQGAGESGGLAVSGDGRYVVVGTRASLEAADTNTAYELYLVDRTAGTARRIAPLAASATGASDPTNTAAPVISADGRSIVLATAAPRVPADTNGLVDVYRLDTATSTWSLVSVPAAGTVNGTTAGAVLQPGSSVYATSPPVAMSADGDLVLFYSARSDLVAGDTNGVVDVFAKRISTGALTRVSTTTSGGNLAGAATGPALALTPDGRFALFPAATASGAVQLYRKTLSGTGVGDLTVVSSVTVAGRATQFAVYRDAGDIDVSDDGRYVALVTAARITTATPTANGSTGLAYRLDTTTGGVPRAGQRPADGVGAPGGARPDRGGMPSSLLQRGPARGRHERPHRPLPPRPGRRRRRAAGPRDRRRQRQRDRRPGRLDRARRVRPADRPHRRPGRRHHLAGAGVGGHQPAARRLREGPGQRHRTLAARLTCRWVALASAAWNRTGSGVPGRPAPPEYVTYHDEEWGTPLRGDDALFERLCLEAFQSGLSWITILRKRPAFRAAFAGFAIDAVAEFGPDDEARLMADAGIVRNRAEDRRRHPQRPRRPAAPRGAVGAAVVLRAGRRAPAAGHPRRRARPPVRSRSRWPRNSSGGASPSWVRPPPMPSCRPPGWSTTTSPTASEHIRLPSPRGADVGRRAGHTGSLLAEHSIDGRRTAFLPRQVWCGWRRRHAWRP